MANKQIYEFTTETTVADDDYIPLSDTSASNATRKMTRQNFLGVTGTVVGEDDTQTLTNKTLTSPKINENVVLSATATELNVTDGATAGIAVASKAVVLDANKDFSFGTGDVTATDVTSTNSVITNTIAERTAASGVTVDGMLIKDNEAPRNATTFGWLEANETWTYASATTFTIAADMTGRYQVGDKIRLKQGGAYKYFYIISASYSAPNTTVTIEGGTSYTLANAAITDNYFSKAATPNGFPASFAYTPTLTSGTGTLTSASATGKFTITGAVMDVWNVITITTNGTGATDLRLTLPRNFADANFSGYGARTDAAMGLTINGALGAGSIDIRTTAANAYPGADGKTYATHVRHHIA